MESPTPDQLRGLARSSPWLWRAVELWLTRDEPDGRASTIHVWVRRPDALRVRDGSGQVRDVTRRPTLLPPWELDPVRDAEGLVLRRPYWGEVLDYDDPTDDDPLLAAVLDPVELADAGGERHNHDGHPQPALTVHRLDATPRHGRETWWAEVSAGAAYVPHDPSAPLLAPGSTRHRLGLDAATGIVVHVERLDGPAIGRGLSVEIVDVDDPSSP